MENHGERIFMKIPFEILRSSSLAARVVAFVHKLAAELRAIHGRKALSSS